MRSWRSVINSNQRTRSLWDSRCSFPSPRSRHLWPISNQCAACYSTTLNSRTHDDATLGRVFDDPKFWRQFSHSNGGWPTPRTGLLQNVHLTNPDGFKTFAVESVKKCRKLVARVVEEKDDDQRSRIVKDLDRLSDLLCRVLDSCDFIRATHPDQMIQDAASAAHAYMYQYMNVLNTYPELYNRLKAAHDDPAVSSKWSQEEKRVADLLLVDFSNSAIDLPEKQRQRFVELSNDIAQAGDTFVRNMRPAQDHIKLPSSRLQGMSLVRIKSISRLGQARLPLASNITSHALQSVTDADVRAKIYSANRTAYNSQVHILDQLLRARAEIAQLSRYESYGHMVLPSKMSQSPEAVRAFLDALLEDNAPKMKMERDRLTVVKAKHLQIDANRVTLNASDWDYYARLRRIQQVVGRQSEERLSAFFSLGSVMQGLSRLFTKLYGIRLVPRDTGLGEVWNDEVRRLDVVNGEGQHIAVLYCDLFEREGKSPNPAHFTLRCSRRITQEEEEESAEEYYIPINDGMPVSSRDPVSGAIYQLPTVALICDFPPASNPRKPTLLSFRDVQTLFHEMGHAIHSFIGRTEYQNVSGTRCATDFAELPSIIMENFASAPEVLQLFARHHETGDPLPYHLVEERLKLEGMAKNMETEAHILQAMLDQACHSALAQSPNFSSTQVFHDVWDANATLKEPDSTSWQGFFGHLVHYGSVYYAYLFDRAISGKIWTQVFRNPENSEGVLSAEAGDLFREEVLKWGGSRDGWECVAGVLRRPELSRGGEAAMKEVGRWGVASKL